MSRQLALSAMIHLRNFVDSITTDPTRMDSPNYVDILTEANVFEEDGFSSPFVVVEPVRAHIHAYLPQQERVLYLPDTFFYANGHFSTALSTNSVLEMQIHALSLMSDVADFDGYCCRLPEQWCPMATLVGFVVPPADSSPDEPRHFTLKLSVYDSSMAAPSTFSVDCFFDSTNCWLKVKMPLPQTFLSVTAKVAGHTATTDRLALRILDLTYLPRPASAAPLTPTSTPACKRSGRWDRPGPSTPSKRPHLSTPPATGPPQPDLPLPEPPLHTPPSTPASLSAASTIDAAPLPLESDWPHHICHPPRKYAADN